MLSGGIKQLALMMECFLLLLLLSFKAKVNRMTLVYLPTTNTKQDPNKNGRSLQDAAEGLAIYGRGVT